MVVAGRSPCSLLVSPGGTAWLPLYGETADNMPSLRDSKTQWGSIPATNMPFLRNFQGTFRSTDHSKLMLQSTTTLLPCYPATLLPATCYLLPATCYLNRYFCHN
jgi:hypothetical protein